MVAVHDRAGDFADPAICAKFNISDHGMNDQQEGQYNVAQLEACFIAEADRQSGADQARNQWIQAKVVLKEQGQQNTQNGCS